MEWTLFIQCMMHFDCKQSIPKWTHSATGNIPTISLWTSYSLNTFCFFYRFDVDLNLNYLKLGMPRSGANIKGSTHSEILPYIFLFVSTFILMNCLIVILFNFKTTFFQNYFSEKRFRHLYDRLKKNVSDPVNKKTLAAVKFVTGFFVEFAKTG